MPRPDRLVRCNNRRLCARNTLVVGNNNIVCGRGNAVAGVGNAVIGDDCVNICGANTFCGTNCVDRDPRAAATFHRPHADRPIRLSARVIVFFARRQRGYAFYESLRKLELICRVVAPRPRAARRTN